MKMTMEEYKLNLQECTKSRNDSAMKRMFDMSLVTPYEAGQYGNTDTDEESE